MRKILVIQGHSGKNNLTRTLAEAYMNGAKESGALIQEIDLAEMDFQFDLPNGYEQLPELEPCLQEAQKMIKAADHLVFAYPNWWGLFPAKLKAFLDRVLLPGFAFAYKNRTPCCDKLLVGKSARLIVTMDTSPLTYRFKYGQPGHIAMKNSILGFCGIKPVKIYSVGKVVNASERQVNKWINKAELMGGRMD